MNGRTERGFALLIALWLVVLVIGVSGATLTQLRTGRLQARNAVTAALARQVAEFGLVNAIQVIEHGLARGTDDQRGAAGAAIRLRTAQADLLRLGRIAAPGGGTYEVDVVDGSSRLPINRADEADLQRLLIGLDLDHMNAAEVAAALADWMDPDDLHRLHGAEWPDHYSDVPGARHPSNGPFQTHGELRYIRGVDEALHEQLVATVTVDPDARVNLNTAPEAVIAALPGLDERAARQIVRARSTRALETLGELNAALDQPARERLQARHAEIRTRVVFVPATYRVISIGTPPGQGHPVRLEARVAVNGSRVSVIRVTDRSPR